MNNNGHCEWCGTGEILSVWKDTDGARGWTCERCGDCEDYSPALPQQPAPRNDHDTVIEEFVHVQQLGIIPRYLALLISANGFTVSAGVASNYTFRYTAGIMVWLDRCRSFGRLVRPTRWELLLKSVETPALYAEALQS